MPTPLTGNLVADFSSFYDAVSKAEKHLVDFSGGADKAGKRLDAMVDGFSGKKVIQDATLMAEAVDRVGGVSKLTESELEKLGAKASEAAAKLRAMGEEVPAKLQAIVSASRDVGAELTAFGNAARSAGVTLTAALTVPIAGVGAAAIKLGIDAVESRNLIEVSFGDMTKAADQWAAKMSQDLGLNRYETEKTAGVLFNMTTGMGLGRAAAFEMSTGVVKLAGDMASFRNIPMEEALTKIKAGLTGETEPLKAIGILVDEATTKTFAYTHGIAEQGTELSAQQKVLARYGSILAQTGNDQGDLARTLESPANQLRIMKERVMEAATALGVELLPMVKSVIGWLADFVPKLQGAVEWFAKLPEPVKVGTVVMLGLVAAAGPVLVIAGQLAISIGALIPVFTAMGIGGPVAAAGVASVGASAGTASVGVGLFGVAILPIIAGMAALTAAVAIGYQAWKLYDESSDRTASAARQTAVDVENLARINKTTGKSFATLAEATAFTTQNLAAHGDASKSAAEQSGQMSDAMKKEIAAQALVAEKLAATTAAQAEAKKTAKAFGEAWGELNSMGASVAETVATINPKLREEVEYYLRAGASVEVLTKAYPALSDAQVKAVDEMMKATIKAQATTDAATLTAYTNQVAALKTIETQRAKSYGTEEQIKMLESLQQAEDDLASHVWLELTSEKDRAKVVADAAKAHEQSDAQLLALRLKVAATINASVATEMTAQVALNKAQGLDAQGAIALQTTAYTTLLAGLVALQATERTGFSQKAQIKVLEDAYTKSLYDEAIAQDKARDAASNNNSALASQISLKKALAQLAANQPIDLTGNAGTVGPLGMQAPLNVSAGNYGTPVYGGTTAGAGGYSTGSTFAAPYTYGARASGGPVSAGVPYWVGELGPELFTPGADGTISEHDLSANARMVQLYAQLRAAGTDAASAVAAVAGLHGDIEQLLVATVQARRNQAAGIAGLSTDLEYMKAIQAQADARASALPENVGAAAASAVLANMRALSADRAMPLGYGSDSVLNTAIASLTAALAPGGGGLAQALANTNAQLAQFHDDASRSGDYLAQQAGGQSGAARMEDLLALVRSAQVANRSGVAPALYTPPPSSSAGLTGASAGGGITINNVFNIVDTESNIIQRVSAAVTRQILQGAKV